MTNNFEYKGHTYTFYRGWGRDSDIEFVKTFLDGQKLPDSSYCVIVHDGADPDNKRHQQVATMSGLKTYWGPIIHRGPFFCDELGNDYQTFISHEWNGEYLTYRQKKHIQAEFENFAFRMRNVKSILFFYRDVIKTKRQSLIFNFYEFSGNDLDKRILKSFKFKKPLKDISYCAIKYNGSAKFSHNDLIFRHDITSSLVYNGPAFYDDEGNDYEIIVSREWNGKKLTAEQQSALQDAFRERTSRKHNIEVVEYCWQTGEEVESK